MATKTIGSLSEMLSSGADPANDVLEVEDVGAGASKKLKLQSLAGAIAPNLAGAGLESDGGSPADLQVTANLRDVSGLSVADGTFIVGNGSNFVSESGATARASIGANDASNLTTGTLADARVTQSNVTQHEGAIIVVSDGKTVSDPNNGDSRGSNAVDLQTVRITDSEVASGGASVVGGGYKNTASSNFATVSGGTNNTASSTSSTVSGGDGNTASNSSSTVSGGRNNTASGINSTVSGGNNNTASGSYSTVSGGRGNTASGNYSTISGGNSNTTSGLRSTVSGGRDNTASGRLSTIPGGTQAHADKIGQWAYASGDFTDQGDAQISALVARNETSDGTSTNLFLDGSGNRLTIPTDTAWEFDIHIIAAEQGMANIKKFHRTGLIVNDGGTVSISSVDTVGTDQTIGSPGAWSVTLSADDSNDALDIQVTGEADTDIRWVARVALTEVSFPA